jgi:hypothetical protein
MKVEPVKLSMKTAAKKVSLPVLKAFLIAAQKAVTIGLTVRSAPAKDRQKTRVAALVEVGTLRIIALISSSIIGAGKQAIPIAPFIGVGAVSIAAIVRRVVNPRAFIDAVSMPIAVAFLFSIPVTVVMATAVAASISIPIFVSITILVTIPVSAPASGVAIGRTRRAIRSLPIATNAIAVTATSLGAAAVVVSPTGA